MEVGKTYRSDSYYLEVIRKWTPKIDRLARFLTGVLNRGFEHVFTQLQPKNVPRKANWMFQFLGADRHDVATRQWQTVEFD